MTEKLAGQLAVGINSPMRIYLSGDLGGGKTLWTRALLRALEKPDECQAPVLPWRLVIKLQADECIIWTYSANRGICRRIWPNWWTMTPLAWWNGRNAPVICRCRIYFCVLIFVGEQSRRITLTGNGEKRERLFEYFALRIKTDYENFLHDAPL